LLIKRETAVSDRQISIYANLLLILTRVI